MFTSSFNSDLWIEDTVWAHVWNVSVIATNQNLWPLIPQKSYGFFEYLQMSNKLLPKGKLWEIPLGEEGDY